jgi:hypothetical protein
MAKMMDIRNRIVATLEAKPGHTFSISQIARSIGSNDKSTSAALGKLLNDGRIDRPQKGLYSSKVKPEPATAPPAPKKPRKVPSPAKPTPAADETLSIVTIDLLMEGEESKIDVEGILVKIRRGENILDARVRKVTEADRTKLQIRFELPDKG